MPHDPDVIYAYGVVSRAFAPAALPRGLDELPVELQPAGEFSALITRVPAAEYDADRIERSSGDVAWLSPRAQAHDRVLTWAQEQGAVVPLPIFTLFGSRQALERSLAGRADALRAALRRVEGADEFGVRVHRREDDMLRAVDELEPSLARLRAEAEDASPGQRYLLERKLAEQRKSAVRAVSQRLANDIFQELRRLARAAVARPLAPDANRAPDATLILNGAFLVDRPGVDAFRAAVGSRMRAHEGHGLVFDFTGPWPPYNFVDAVDGAP